MSDDLRSTIEAAASTPEVSHEAPVQAESSPAPVETAPVSSDTEPSRTDDVGGSRIPDAPADQRRADAPPSIEEVAGAEDKAVANKPETVEEKAARQRVDRAPQSWKGDAKKLWEQLPLQVRQEVARRERDMMPVMQQAADYKQKIDAMVGVMNPHSERIMSTYGDPVRAVDSLLRTEAVLHSGTQMQKAQMVAQIINSFGIDIHTLDSVLAGQPAPEQVQQQSNIEALLNQRLAPFQQFLQQQQAREAQYAQQTQQQASMTVEQMATDDRYPYFNEVRNDMADIIELNARRGVAISLEDAYTRAIRMNDDTFRATSVREHQQGSQQAALDAHRAAQAAKGASVSVSGSPSANGKQQLGSSFDLRGTIAAAFDGGRL